MALKDTENNYGLITKFLHWGIAIIIIGLFALGYWMRTLDYYSAWYQRAPHIHESIGLILFVLVPFFLVWCVRNKTPDQSYLKSYEQVSASLMKKALYLLIFAILCTGYLMSTAGNAPVDFFDIGSVPATLQFDDKKLLIGNLHRYFAYAIIGFAVLHALAALKHHFIEKDDTLRRMLPFYKKK